MTFEEVKKLNLPGKTIRILFKNGDQKTIQVERTEPPPNGAGPSLIIVGREVGTGEQAGANGPHCRYLIWWQVVVEEIKILEEEQIRR